MLAIDAGNTRVKWAVREGVRWRERGTVATAHAARLADALPSGALGLAVAANVAGQSVEEAINAALAGRVSRIHWIRSTAEQCGVTNRYEQPSQLGVDRWAALIGARAMRPHASVVVCAGTATTIDLLDSDGVFQGGMILPGTDLMRRSLARGTAQLPGEGGRRVELPRNTADAIETGCLSAQAGAIERMFARIAAERGSACVLTGGAAERIAPLLAMPVVRADDLVLAGLARIGDSL